MKAVSAVLVAAVCIQIAGAVQLKSKAINRQLDQTDRVSAGKWVQFDGWLSTVDIADDQTVIGTNGNDDIYLRIGIGGQWGQLPGKLRQVSTGGKDRYVGVSANQQIWTWANGNWQNIPGAAVWASIGNDGTIWVVN